MPGKEVLWFVAIYHTHQPCLKCRGWLDKIRYEKRIRVRTGVSYRMVCPACGWSDGPDLSKVRGRTCGATTGPPSLRFFTRVVVPAEIEEMARRARADIRAGDGGYIITLSSLARSWDPEIRATGGVFRLAPDRQRPFDWRITRPAVPASRGACLLR